MVVGHLDLCMHALPIWRLYLIKVTLLFLLRGQVVWDGAPVKRYAIIEVARQANGELRCGLTHEGHAQVHSRRYAPLSSFRSSRRLLECTA